ncbi:hypothetical protein DVH24_037828 [Malus domestica]|uniref:Uncharacterized protein n=1 Tax=Malus domestica TaxID=3750 RepID=A0A498JWI8_MALDO|nr:hypothetical protein DVH24_037828 [Malus domestica]
MLAEVSCRLKEAMVGFKGVFGWISGFKGLFGWIVDVVFLVGVDMGKRRRRWRGEGRLGWEGARVDGEEEEE